MMNPNRRPADPPHDLGATSRSSSDNKEPRGASRQPALDTSLSALLRKNVEVIQQLEQAADAQRTPADRLAAAISQFTGSMRFVLVHVAWFGIWIVVNTIPAIPSSWQIDPFPFTFLTFVVSLEAIFLSTFILMSQNHEKRIEQRRANLDLQINLLSEQENSLMLKMLESIERKLHIPTDPEAQCLQEATQPENIVEAIEESMEEKS